jgi:hypothetical protein
MISYADIFPASIFITVAILSHTEPWLVILSDPESY